MTGSEKVFFDTAPFIYLVENHPMYYLPVAGYVTDLAENDIPLLTSVITIAELFVKPKRNNDEGLLKDFKNTLEVLNFSVLEIDFKIAELSATLRSKYSFLKGLDALQLAAALSNDCKKFFTNDKKLSQVTEIEIILVDNLLH